MKGQKVEVFGVQISAVNFPCAAEEIISAARDRRSFAMSALAVHGLMTAARNPGFRQAVNSIDLVTSDGQPVRWAMNLLHNTKLESRVSGPDLMAWVCEYAAKEGLGIYLFGSTRETLESLSHNLSTNFPGIKICGMQEDRFREATFEEDQEDISRINRSGANIVLVGRGCPRQEFWVAEHRGKINAPMMAVGAAFDYHSGNLKRAPRWMQDNGLEWLYRLAQEPRRLFVRYFKTNLLFLWHLALDLSKKITQSA